MRAIPRVAVFRRESPRLRAGSALRATGSATALGCLLAVALGAPAAAQEPETGVGAEEIRALLLGGFEQHRATDLEFARAIPDSALRWAPTEGVRDFAEQVAHSAMDNVMFVARFVGGEAPPSFGDSAVYLNDKEELERAVGAAYDWVSGRLRDLPAAELLAETEMFGRSIPKWRVFLVGLHHADWTRGQLVPYFRLNGVEPPRWRPY